MWAGPTLTTLVTFNNSNGANPYAGLIFDAGGNLYGTTYLGGASGFGTAFQIAAGTHALTTLATFNSINGSHLNAGLIADTAGNLYGTTQRGGASSNFGTVFQIAVGTHALTTLATFNDGNGANPYAGLVADTAGNLYGTTEAGGAYNGSGTIFQIAAGSHAFTTVLSYVDSNGPPRVYNGKNPYAALISDGAGNLYGTTKQGGSSSLGTVFKFSTGSNALTTLASFDGAKGNYPFGALIADAAGNLYGTTLQGGANVVGTVFQVAAGTNVLTTLATFTGNNGAAPSAGLIADAAGNLYGTTSVGGASNLGTVFQIASGTHTLTTLATFNNVNGANPYSSLIADSVGNLYGTTYNGGANGSGTAFELAGTGFVVPEPATFSLLAFAGLPLLRRRRRVAT